MNRTEIYQTVTADIVKLMEEGKKPWIMPFRPGLTFCPPIRITGDEYRGGNLLVLWIMQQLKGYRSNRWMTFRQASSLDGKVRKGEKSTPVVWFSHVPKDRKDPENDETIPIVKYFRVFNVDQIDNLPEQYYPQELEQITEEQRIQKAEDFFRPIRFNAEPDYHKACYKPRSDVVCMPKFTHFRSGEAFYATLAHELVHWTGHESRLDRIDSNQRAKKKDYAFEELIAELGAAFVCAHVGIGTEEREGHAAYLQSWLKALKNDPAYLYQAAAQAQKACDLLINLSEGEEHGTSQGQAA